MSSEISPTNNDELDNLRLILQISYERCNQLSNINIQLIEIICVLIVGLFAFFATAYYVSTDPTRYYSLILVIHLIIITLIIWRFYAHVIDNSIVEMYKKILFCENKISLPQQLSLQSSLETSLKLCDYSNYDQQTDENKNKILLKLIDEERIGYRYHDNVDAIAWTIIGILLLIQFAAAIMRSIQLSNMDYEFYLIILPSFYFAISLIFEFDFLSKICNAHIQRNPTDEDINLIISDMENPKKHENQGEFVMSASKVILYSGTVLLSLGLLYMIILFLSGKMQFSPIDFVTIGLGFIGVAMAIPQFEKEFKKTERK